MSKPVLEVKNLTVAYHSYGNQPNIALNDVSLDVQPGEVVGLVGESGSGKTTLARAIMGMVPVPGAIESGTVRFGDTVLTRMPREELRTLRGRDLTMIVPNPRGELNPLVRVGRQVADVARVHLGMKRAEAREAALEMLRSVSIPDPERRFDAYPYELSGGMAQRVVIAMALICSPKFVISDDATSGLDVTVQAQVLELLRRLCRENETSMLYITRDIGVAAHFCDRIGIIYNGHIVEIAPKKALFRDPKHPYSNMLMAAFTQNPKLRRIWNVREANRFSMERVPVNPCPYARRCVKAETRCVAEGPSMQPLAREHEVRCHFPVER